MDDPNTREAVQSVGLDGQITVSEVPIGDQVTEGQQEDNESESGSVASSAESLAVERVKKQSKSAGLKARSEIMKKMSEMRKKELAVRQEMENEERALRQRREKMELELKIQQEQTQLEAEMAEANAEIALISQQISADMGITQRTPHLQQPQELTASREVHEAQRVHSQASHKSNQSDVLLDHLSKQVSRTLLPQAEVPRFDGKITEYHAFVRAFETRIASRTDSDDEKLHFLDQFTRGKPNDLVKGCMHLEPEIGYPQARKLLEERYGSHVRLTSAYLEMVENWPPVRNAAALDEFGIFLTSCENAMMATNALHELNIPHNMRMVVDKLQPYLQDRWRRHAYGIVDSGSSVQFTHLAQFVRREAAIANDPLFGKDIGRSTEKTMKKVLTTSVVSDITNEEQVPAIAPEPVKNRAAECPYCKDSHPLDLCMALGEKGREEKIEFVMKSRRCFGCLRKGHTARFCKDRTMCVRCSGRHPTALHEDRNVKEDSRPESGRSEPTTVGVGKVNAISDRSGPGGGMSIIPVKVRTAVGRIVTTHALLDSGSSATFCTNSLLKQLQYEGAVRTTLTLSTVQAKRQQVKTLVASGLQIAGLEENGFIPLPAVFTLDEIPVSQEDILTRADIERWPHLQALPLPTANADIGLMIGNNAPACMEPWDIMHGPEENAPFALKTRIGWVVCGPTKANGGSQVKVNRVLVDGERLDELLNRLYNQDFPENASEERCGPSEEDRKWLRKVEATCEKVEGGRYEISLPLKNEDTKLPNNKGCAQRRLCGLKRRLERDKQFSKDYCEFMQGMLDHGHAEKVPREKLHRDDGKVWYLPHHGIYHPQKQKIRVVFDCSAKFRDVSLNECLLQGPDLTSPLLDVLLRFREHPVAFMADVEAMFFQVQVPDGDRDCLRYLWWPKGDTSAEPEEFRMRVHLFGATSSPSCANYALRRSVDDAGELVDPAVVDTVKRSFYVDDCLKSMPDVDGAVTLAKELIEVCTIGGFNLTKFVSNSRELLKSLPQDHRGKQLKDLDLGRDPLPMERALGVCWSVDSDELVFRQAQKDRPHTRRGMLSTIGSMYDPLGMVSPFTVRGRLIFQELTRLQLGWDEEIPAMQKRQWEEWLHDLQNVAGVSMMRCVEPDSFGRVVRSELHHFADASESSYAAASYLRLTNEEGGIHCSFLLGKARVAPIKKITVPRLELAAATIAVRMNRVLIQALDMSITDVTFWTDSTTVLRYIRNDTARYHTFVANRIAVIKDGSKQSQWRYVGSKINVADDATRGIQSERWLRGPEFLRHSDEYWPEEPLALMSPNPDPDPEVKREATVGATTPVELNPTQRLISHYSSWFRLRRAVAWWRRLPSILRARRDAAGSAAEKVSGPVSPAELECAEIAIIRAVQSEEFSKDIIDLKKGSKSVKKASPLWKLDPRLINGMLRVGGRLHSADIGSDMRHPWLLPYRGHVTDLIIRHVHAVVGHQGREHVLSSLRDKYWIIKGNSAVRRVLGRCMVCRKNQGAPVQQMMADLPEDRLKPDEPPFTSVGTDLFGPFFTKRGRAQVKRYGVIFTCMTTRAIHIEVAESLSTSSFINALRRFVCRRGQVRLIRSDRGTNLVGAEKELRLATDKWNERQISECMLQRNVQWQFNPPGASHWGGTWERQIRTIRKILSALMTQQLLDDELLVTLLCEVEAIVNSRPLTTVSADHRDPEPLTPNHLLLLKRCQALPPGVFSRQDVYARRRWRQVQYMADVFWNRWRREYLVNLQARKKWTRRRANLQDGDVVLIMDQTVPRGSWQMGIVKECTVGRDGLIRSALVKTGHTLLRRPISKLVLLEENA